MGRTQATLLTLGLLCAVQPLAATADRSPAAKTVPASQTPGELVQQLGDPSFSLRSQAMTRLVDLGVDAIEALQRGVQSKDREISFRSWRALRMVQENDFQRRLQAFAAGCDATENYQLPGWNRFFKGVGGSPEARALFVEMQQAEPELLETLEQSSEKIGDRLAERIVELQASVQLGRQTERLSLGTIATILFILNQEEIELPTVVTQSIGSYFRVPSFAGAMQAGSQRDLLRKMLGTWIEKSTGWDAYHGIYLAMQYDLPKGLVPARKILTGEIDGQNQSYFVCYALLAYAKFGNQSHIDLIEPYLNDETPYGGAVAAGGNAKNRTQVRDIALATLVRLTDQDPKDFGFNRLRMGGSQVFNTSSLAFENDEKRAAAIKKWMLYRAQQPPEKAVLERSDEN